MEENTVLISVILPMYNASNTIERVLDSVKNQTYLCNYEVLVVNDGSNDQSKNIVENYISSNPYFNVLLIDQENSGVSKARNEGLRISKGDYIAFLDSDDVWFPNKIEEQMKLLNSRHDIDLLGCAFDGLYLSSLSDGGLKKITVDNIIYKNYFQPSTVIMKRKVLEEIGYFDESQRYAEEGNYFIRIASNFNCYFWNKKVINYGDGKSGFGVSGLSSNLREMHKGIIKNLKFAYKNNLISYNQYISARAISQIKYLRRILIVRLRQ